MSEVEKRYMYYVPYLAYGAHGWTIVGRTAPVETAEDVRSVIEAIGESGTTRDVVPLAFHLLRVDEGG